MPPQASILRPSKTPNFDKPKSATLQCPSPSIRMLSNLMSLQIKDVYSMLVTTVLLSNVLQLHQLVQKQSTMSLPVSVQIKKHTDDYSIEDIKKAIRNLKNNKAAGSDGIHLESIKTEEINYQI